MSTQITYTFSIQPVGGMNAAALAALLVDPILDVDTLWLYGLRVISDVTTDVSIPTRTIVVGTVPSAPGTIVPAIDGSTLPGGAITGYTVTAAGLDFIRPPVLAVVDPSGSGYGATCYAQLGVKAVIVGGSMIAPYSNPVIYVSGGEPAPGAVAPTFGITVVAETITAINVLTPGGPYNVPPTLLISDSTGGGQTATAQLGLIAAVPSKHGYNYKAGTTVTINPYFKALYPDVSLGVQVQPTAVQGWMLDIINKNINVNVVASIGVVA